jgi:hypothetical protein
MQQGGVLFYLAPSINSFSAAYPFEELSVLPAAGAKTMSM